MEKLEIGNLYSMIQKLSNFGCRWLDSDGENNARQFILDKFEEFGLENISREYFLCHNYIPKEYGLKVLSPTKLDLVCKPLEYSGNSEVEGELVFLGEFKEDDANTISNLNIDLEGKICLIVSDTPAFFIPALAERGAIGIIVASEAPDNLIRMLAAKSYPPNFDDPSKWKVELPGVSISKRDLYRLLSFTSSGKVVVRIEHRWESKISETCNILGVVEGDTDESIVVGAHYDSQMKTIGVWDNLTGLTTLIELARIFSKVKVHRRIIFVAFGAEEIGLWGSAFFVDKRRSELRENCIAMFCLDALSSAFPAEKSLWSEGKIREFIIQRAREYGTPIDNVKEPILSYSDYYPFVVEGIPVAMLWEYPPINPYYHTEKDLLKYVDISRLHSMGELNRKIIGEVNSVGYRF
ncbi:MAG: M28 family peptidase [Candidatus Caldarchaeales archaeon]